MPVASKLWPSQIGLQHSIIPEVIMHILLVEDSSTLSSLFRVQLRQLGQHTLTAAATKAQALAAFEEETFDLILVDMGLEGQQRMGLEILQAMKAEKPAQRVGILSSNDLREIVRLSQEAGAEFYMVKPFTLEGLAVVITGSKEAIRHHVPEVGEGRLIAF
jgi:two-component system chemotaxis response regulator CheY